jgi:4-hydroxyphenylacetate 3-monooxygenase
VNEYKQRISCKRNVWLNGNLMTDVTKEVAFKGAIECIHKFYELQKHQPNVFLSNDENQNIFYHISLMIPRSPEDLRKKRIAYKSSADLSYGMLGRTPDFVNAILVALASNSRILGENKYTSFAENAVRYYEYCKLFNLFVCHGAINPQIDRSRSLGEQSNQYNAVQVVNTNMKGITVNGAKMIVTLAPIADEMLVFNMPGLKPGDEKYAVAFATPISTEGIKIICRKSLIKNELKKFDHPIANTFDEMDAYVIFENVFVPWERVFVYQDVEKSNLFFDKTLARNHSGHQDIVRALSKAEFVAGIGIKLAKSLGLDGFINIQEKLGELTTYIEIIKAGILQCESEAQISPEGVFIPNIYAIQSVRYNFPKMYERMVKHLQSFSAGSMLSTPHHGDFENDNASCLEEVLKGTIIDAKTRACLLNLAWDITGDGFGQRQLVYEHYHAGDPMRIAAQQYLAYDYSSLVEKVENVLKMSMEE